MDADVRRDAQAEAATVGEDWGQLTWLAGRSVGNADGVTLGRVVIGEGRSNPRHAHHGCEEVLHLVSGELTHTVGEDQVVLHGGDTLVVPAGQFHNATNTGSGDAVMFVAYSSGDRDFEPEDT